jgi:hypothetical protein
MNDLLAYDRNGSSMCDSYMTGWHKPLQYNFYLSTALQKQLHLFFWKMFKILDQLVHVKFVYAQKLGPYFLTFVSLNLGINPDIA